MHLPPVLSTVNNPSQGVWLDELPADVCNRIATFVLAPLYDVNAINLSKVSEKQRMAVKNDLSIDFNLWELNGSLLSWCCGKKLVAEFITLLGSDAKEIEAPGYALYTEDVEKCFKTLTLVKASIYNCPHLFYALAYARNLRALSLRFSRFDDLKSFVKRLSALDLREFSLTTVSSLCLHEILSNNPDEYSTLATWFPNIERLKLACYCCGGPEHPRSYLWRVAEQFPKLNDVFIGEGVPDDAIDRLREMDRVSVRAAGVFQLLDVVPDRVVHVDTYDLYRHCLNGTRTLHSSHLSLLANCTRLEELQGLLTPGCEYGLIKVMGNLRVLSIEFDVKECEDGEVRKVYEPEEGVFFEAIKAAPYLKVINLEGGRIKRRELRNILVESGDRLEEYEEVLRKKCREEIEYTTESLKEELQQLIETLETAALHNPNLRSFHLDAFVNLTDKDNVESELLTYDATIAVLGRHAPFLPMRPFKALRNRFKNNHELSCRCTHASD